MSHDAEVMTRGAPYREPNDLTLGGFVDRETLRFVRDYDHPPARVWAAITAPDQLGVWLWPCLAFEARPGGRCAFDLEGRRLELPITAFEPERTLELGRHLRFELTPRGDGCHLVFTLKRPPDGWSPMGMAGFHGWLGRLGRLLADRPQAETELWASGIWNDVFAHYEWEVRRYVSDGAPPIWRVHFDEGDPALTAEAASRLDELAQLLKARDLAVTIDGFGDDPGSMEDSVTLCGARVEAARARLQAAGVAAERINVGFVLGNYHYLVERDCAAGRAYNRRLELRPVY